MTSPTGPHRTGRQPAQSYGPPPGYGPADQGPRNGRPPRPTPPPEAWRPASYEDDATSALTVQPAHAAPDGPDDEATGLIAVQRPERTAPSPYDDAATSAIAVQPAPRHPGRTASSPYDDAPTGAIGVQPARPTGPDAEATGFIPVRPPAGRSDDAATGLIPVQAPAAAAPADSAEGPQEPKAGRLPNLDLDLSPKALRRSWREARPPRTIRWAFLATLLVPALNVVIVVIDLLFVAALYGGYSVGTLLGGSIMQAVWWLVAALVATWVAVQMRAGRQWARILLGVLAVAGLLVTVQSVLGTLTYIGLSGLPGLVRLVLLLISALLCVAIVVLLLRPVRNVYFK